MRAVIAASIFGNRLGSADMKSRPPDSAETLRAAYRDTLTNVGALADELDSAGWERPTGCPGWNVHDIVAHVCALESILAGRGQPDHQVPEGLPYIRNAPGAFMEIGVDYRRPWPVERLLAELHELTELRVSELDQIRDDQLDDEVQGLFGMSPRRSLLAIRIHDVWSHEQDIRRAVARPGGLDGPAGTFARDFMLRQLARTVQAAVAPPAGTTVRLELTGPGGATRWIAFDGERGWVGTSGDDAELRLRMDLPTLTVLCCGRDDAEAPGRVSIDGDAGVARRMIASFAFTP